MMRNGIVYPQAPLAPLTDETASGSPLIAAPTTKANQLAPSMMKHPVCRAMWPTPSANNQKGGITGLNGGSGARASLRKLVGREMQLQMSGGQLNPTWVEWLMGFPLGWTDLKD